jgi:hypothetical protein
MEEMVAAAHPLKYFTLGGKRWSDPYLNGNTG